MEISLFSLWVGKEVKRNCHHYQEIEQFSDELLVKGFSWKIAENSDFHQGTLNVQINFEIKTGFLLVEVFRKNLKKNLINFDI